MCNPDETRLTLKREEMHQSRIDEDRKGLACAVDFLDLACQELKSINTKLNWLTTEAMKRSTPIQDGEEGA